LEYAAYKLFRASVLAGILVVTLCCALVLAKSGGTNPRDGRHSALALTFAKAPTSASSFGKCAQTADLAPVHANITAPGPSTHELTIARTPAKLFTLVARYSGRAPPSAA